MGNSNRKAVMRLMYEEGKKFLLEICPPNIKNEELEKYFNIKQSFKSKNDILHVLLVSLQDKQMSNNVIGLLREERKDRFRKILFDYDSNQILDHYNEDSLLKIFSENFKINNIESSHNLWRLYAKSIISACRFMNRFKDAQDFKNFVGIFSYNNLTASALPMLLEKEVKGLGFSLACHFLKDLGFSEYPKPDVHIKEIFIAFDLCENTDYGVYGAVVEMAKEVNDTAYNLDRLFWLIASGNYYMHNVNIGKNKEKYINRVKSLCSLGV